MKFKINYRNICFFINFFCNKFHPLKAVKMHEQYLPQVKSEARNVKE